MMQQTFSEEVQQNKIEIKRERKKRCIPERI
jgi:hypothetical protein